MTPQFKLTSPEIMKIIALFRENNLSYNLFKCEHIFAGKNKNLDVLFETEQDYLKAAQLLEQERFKLYFSERFEQFKKMYVRFEDNFPLAVHLHREVAWHGLKALDKKPIFLRQKEIAPGINVPSPEDSLLIQTGHILFENFKIKDKERELINNLLNLEDLKGDYIRAQLQRNCWEKSFYRLLKKIKSGKDLKKREVFFHFGRRVLSKPKDFITLVQKIMRKVILKLNPQRKGTLIALIGVNGAGKTTLTNKLIETYRPFTELIGKEINGYYYGWVPFSPLAKVATKLFRKRNTFKEASKIDQNYRFSLLQEGLFCYNYIDYSLRYLFQIYPLLRKGKIIVTDRYFYDLYGQYLYAEKSLGISLLIKLFPKPDHLFVLEANTNRIMNREKANRDYSDPSNEDKEEKERRVKSKEYLDSQIKRYRRLSTLCGGRIVNTESKIKENINEMIEESWKGVVGGDYILKK